MTKPPPSLKPEALASLVERLNDGAREHSGSSLNNGCCDCGISANLCAEAATTIETLEADVAALRDALAKCAEIVDLHLYRQSEKVEDVKLIARTTLERTAR